MRSAGIVVRQQRPVMRINMDTQELSMELSHRRESRPGDAQCKDYLLIANAAALEQDRLIP